MTISNDDGMPGAEAGGAAALLADPPAGAPADAAAAGAGTEAGAPSAGWWKNDGFAVSAERQDGAPSNAEWLANKNFPSFEDLVKSARALEGKLGADRVAVPKGPEDAEGWAAIRKAIGVPEQPDGYALKLADGYDEGFVGGFREAAHKLGLAPHQAQQLVEWFEGTSAAEAQTNAERAGAELKEAWKADYGANMEHARRGMTRMGLTPDDLNGMAAGYGLSKTMQLMAKLGRMAGEDSGLPGGGGGAAAVTLETLRARKAEILASRDLQAKLRAGDPGLRGEWQKILDAEVKAATA